MRSMARRSAAQTAATSVLRLEGFALRLSCLRPRFTQYSLTRLFKTESERVLV